MPSSKTEMFVNKTLRVVLSGLEKSKQKPKKYELDEYRSEKQYLILGTSEYKFFDNAARLK